MPDKQGVTRNWGRTITAAGVSLGKSLLLSAVVLGPGMLLIEENRFLGWLWLLIGSFALMAWSYRKEWRMTRTGIIVPPLAAIGAYVLQLAIFEQAPSLLWVALALAAGLAVGFVRAETHAVFIRDNAVFAQRTVGFLGVWLICYLISQYFSMMGQKKYLAIAHASGAFSAAMLTMVAIVLWRKFSGQRRELAASALSVKVYLPGRRKPRTKVDARKRKGSTTTKLLPPLFLAICAGGFGARSIDASSESVAMQAPSNLYFDEPVPESRAFQNGPAALPMIDYVSGCSVVLRIYTPNTNSPDGLPTSYLHSVGIRNYCSANPGASVCAQCWNSGSSGQIATGSNRRAEAAAAAAIAAAILILIGGAAVNIATAVAEATSRANAAIATDAAASNGQTGTPRGKRPSRAAGSPLVQAKAPEIINPYEDSPFETDGAGHYWAPDDNGEWVWMDAGAAREAAAAMQREIGRRDRERETFERDSQEAIARAQAEASARDDAERARIAEEVAAQEASRLAESEPETEVGAGGEIENGRTKLIIDMLSGTSGVDNTGIGWTTNFIARWVGGAVIETGKLIHDAPGELASLLSRGATAAWEELTNPANWEATVETVKDLTSLPSGDWRRQGKTAANVAEGVFVVGKVVSHLGQAAFDKGLVGTAVAVGKAVVNVENWEKAVDPDVPVTERFGRAVWGVFDTGGLLIGAGATAVQGIRKIDALMRSADIASDVARGTGLAGGARAARLGDAGSDVARSADLASDAASTADKTGSVAGAAGVAENADGLSDLARAADATGDTAKAADKTSAASRAAGRVARQSDLPPPKTLDELRDALRGQKRGAAAEAGTGKNIERAGIPDMATDPKGYVRELPTGALVDRNLALGSGYTGYQIDDMARFAKQENVIVGARTTNIDSMRHIRDGRGVPKPSTIKSKTISAEDVYLGGPKAEDQGLVGYFRPRKPDRASVPAELWDRVNDRYGQRLEEYAKLRKEVDRMVAQGAVVEREGKLHAVIRNADGTTTLKPYAGDIDAVYFRSGTRPHDFISSGPEYERLKAAWMGRENPSSGIPQYWGRSGAPGQHGAEVNVVADLTYGKIPGTPEYEQALAKARELHGNLARSHYSGKEVVLEMGNDGHLRRGIRFTEETPLPELSGLN